MRIMKELFVEESKIVYKRATGNRVLVGLDYPRVLSLLFSDAEAAIAWCEGAPTKPISYSFRVDV